jgi:hypothetical protein
VWMGRKKMWIRTEKGNEARWVTCRSSVEFGGKWVRIVGGSPDTGL